MATRLGTIATGVMLLVGVNAGGAHGEGAASVTSSGDFSWRATDVKRMANCAASQWYNDGQSGDEITECDTVGTNGYWDYVRLGKGAYAKLDGKKVAYRSDRSCPSKRGRYVKCYYVGGKSRGNPVITVSIISSNSEGMNVAVDWYYL